MTPASARLIVAAGIVLVLVLALLLARGSAPDSRLRRARRRTDRARRRLYAARAAAMLRSAGRAPALPIRFPAQFGEDAYLFDLFEGKLHGFFIEAGAYDGVTISATYALEALGWEGLLVEPLPERARECVRNRPGSRVVQAALSMRGSEATARFAIVCADSERIPDSRSFLAHGERPSDLPRGAQITEVDVPVTTLDTLLEEHEGPIDLAVIDVEGGEAGVLEGFSLGRFRPRVLVVEDNTLGRDARVSQALTGAGYALVTVLGVNRIWIHGDEEALFRRALEIESRRFAPVRL